MKTFCFVCSLIMIIFALNAQQPLPCKTVTQSDFSGSNPVVKSNCMYSSTPLGFSGNTSALMEATDFIKFLPGSKITVDNSSNFVARINPNAYSIVWFEPTTYGSVQKHEKLELGIGIPLHVKEKITNFFHKNGGIYLNPFDPEDISVEVMFVGELNLGFITAPFPITRYGFWFEDFIVEEYMDVFANDTYDYLKWTKIEENPYPFRVRFAPPFEGNWKFKAKVFIHSSLVYESELYDFQAVSSNNPGYVYVGENNKYLKLGNNMFFPKGINIFELHCRNCGVGHAGKECHTGCFNFAVGPPSLGDIATAPWGPKESMNPFVYRLYRTDMKEMKNRGINSFRFIMAPWGSDIEFEECNNYYDRMHFAWEIDSIVEKAKELNLYMIFNTLVHFTLENPSQYEMTGWDWPEHYLQPGFFRDSQGNLLNPPPTPAEIEQYDPTPFCYKGDFNLSNPLEFLTNQQAIKSYQNKLRYIASRWSYSTNIMSFELVSEINQIGAKGGYDDVGNYTNSYSGDYMQFSGNTPLNIAKIAQEKVFYWHKFMSDYLKEEVRVMQLVNPSYTNIHMNSRDKDLTFFYKNIFFNSYNEHRKNNPVNRFNIHFEKILVLQTGTEKPLINSEFDFDIQKSKITKIPDECFYFFELKRNLLIAPFLGTAGFFIWKHNFRHNDIYYTDLFAQAETIFQATIGNVDFDAENFQSRKLESLSSSQNVLLDNFWHAFRLTGSNRENVDNLIESYVLIKKHPENNNFRDYAIGVVFNKSFNFVSYYANSYCFSYIDSLIHHLDTTVSPNGLIDNNIPIHLRTPNNFVPTATGFSNHKITLKMTPNGKKYTIQYYNALSGQLLTAYTQYNSKPELILPPLSGDATCPIVYFVVRNTSKSTNDNDTVFPAEYAKLLNENFNFFTSTEPTDVENNSNQKIIVYPNPAKDKLYIMLPNDSENNYIAQIFSIEGQLLIENEFNTDSFVMDISGLPNGIYVINIYSNRIFYTTKIIKQ